MKFQLSLLLLLISFLACTRTSKGDLNDFREVNIEDLEPASAPEGLVLRDSVWQADKGWELVSSKDGQRVMLMQTGTNTGSAGFECKCNTGTGKCGLRRDIVMCIADECKDCKTVLKIFNNRVTIDRAMW